MRITVSHEVCLPDPFKVARYKKAPELGPRILFFSGGTALRNLSRTLIEYTHNSIHIITPFDSGGSSAVIRKAFHMPSIGDERARLMDLADKSFQGNLEIFVLFAYRFAKEGEQEELLAELMLMISGKHSLVAAIPDPMRKIIRNYLRLFADRMPKHFDLRGASIGNLILTAGYLEQRRHLDPVIYIFSQLVRVQGIVRPVLSKSLHLGARLDDGSVLIGQHLLTGKEVPPIANSIGEVFLSEKDDEPVEVRPQIRKKTKELILSAELLCYPMGSFYSSIIANLLPGGVGKTISENHAPKVFIPNTGTDPEAYGLDLMGQVEQLIHYGRADAPDLIEPADILNFVLLDEQQRLYQGRLDEERLKKLGISVVRCPLVTNTSFPQIDAERLAKVLLSLV